MTQSETRRTFEPLDELRYKRVISASLSPGGTQVVYALKENDIEKETTATNLWLIDLENESTKQLTFGDKNNLSPEWSPDGTQIVFRSDRSEKPQVYVLPVNGGEARQLTDLKQGVMGDPVWSPDGQHIAFTAGPDGEPPDPTKPYRVTRFVYRFDGVGFLDPVIQNIFIIPAAGGEPRQLTDDDHFDRDLHWSPDSKEILYLSAWDPDRSDLFSVKVRVVNLDAEKKELLDLDWGWISNAKWSHDGRKVIFAGVESGQPMGSKANLWTYDRKSGQVECRTKTLKFGNVYGFGNYLALNDKEIFAGVQRHGMDEIYKIAITGDESFKPTIQGKRSAMLLDVQQNVILFSVSTPHNPSELYITRRDGQNERQITANNTGWLSELDLPDAEQLIFASEGNVEVEGWIMKPTTGEAPYPTILYIHGGPHGAYGYFYRPDFHMLAGAGFAVLYLNPRGSSGYGDEFSTALSGNWGVMDYKDLMAGVDHVIEKGLADPDKLGVCGLSYGGFLTTFTVGQTDRFKAAVAENPITDLVSRYGTADMGPWGSLGELGGKPHEIPEVYRRSSPITYAHKCTTPTLLVQGEMDYRCPAGQSEQFYTTLKANGCITEMLRLPNMPHVGSINGPIEVQKAQNDALLDWMNRYVLGKSSDQTA